ncbi:tol-pal system protein YbgF [Thalassotalea aquiviva]|uniref:tol-pal system protein YbgF n=1 Tax=Thalassotalea aquiviva TaxID=3242415 RepID=UPI00352B007C
MKSNKLLLGLMVAAGAFQALAAEPAPVSDINQQVQQQSDVATLQRLLQARNRALNDLQMQVDAMQVELSELRGLTEEQAHTIRQILQRQREIYQEIDRRLSAAPAATVTPITPSNSGSSIAYSDNFTENEAYDHAVNLVLKHKQYDRAIAEFSSFNSKYPNSTYSANAHYWLGQLLFNKGDLAAAATEFNNVINNFENSNKRSDAMLKLGMVAQKQNDIAKAKDLYNRVISEYQGSSAAQLAQARLANL